MAPTPRPLPRPDHEPTREALSAIEDSGRQALVELRRLLGLLREQPGTATRSPQPGLRDLEGLLRGVGQAGLPVALDVVGDPVELPPGLDLAAYRIVQEALTNSLKHAAAAHAKVSIRYGVHDLSLEITDDGQAADDQHSAGQHTCVLRVSGPTHPT